MPRAADRRKRAQAAGSRPAPADPAAPSPEPDPSVAKRAAPRVVAGFELHELKRLIHLVQRTGIGELELNAGGRSVRISATPSNGVPWVATGPGVAAPAAGRP